MRGGRGRPKGESERRGRCWCWGGGSGLKRRFGLMFECLCYKSAVTGSRETGRLYQRLAWRGPRGKKTQRDSPPSGPLLSARGQEEKKKQAQPKRDSHTVRPAHTGAASSGHTTQPAAQPGPKKEKLSEICRHLAEAQHLTAVPPENTRG